MTETLQANTETLASTGAVSEPHHSYTSLNTYLNVCQLQYYYRYVEKAQPERTAVALPFGTAMHEALSRQAQAAKSGKLLPAKELLDAFAVFFRANCDAAENLVFRREETYDDQIDLAARMFETVTKEWVDYYNIRSVAEPFRMELPGLSRPLVGELDMVVTETTPFDEQGDAPRPVVVDFKTASRSWSEDQPHRALQATVYAYGYREKHGVTPSCRFDVITKTKQPKVQHLRTVRGEDSFLRLEKLLVAADRAIQAGVFLPSETSFACGDCPFAGRCADWHCETSRRISLPPQDIQAIQPPQYRVAV